MLLPDLSASTSSAKLDLLSSIDSNFDSIIETPAPPLSMGEILALWGVGFKGRPVKRVLSLGDILRMLVSPFFMDIDEERSGDE